MTQPISITLLAEHDLAARFPERTREIFEHAVARREQELITLKESRQLLSWHPLHTLKTILIAGAVTFLLGVALSQVVAFGKFYAQAKRWNVAVPLPVLGTKMIDLGSQVPTSTALAVVAQLPAYGWRESLVAAIAVMITILAERAIVSAFHWKKTRILRRTEDALRRDIDTLTRWMHNEPKP